MALTSYCATCDNPDPAGCDHKTHRYLDPIEYLPGPNGLIIIPPDEQERWHNPPAIVHSKTIPATVQSREPRDIQALVVDLENHMYLEPHLEGILRNKYAKDPLKVTLLVEHVIGKVGSLNSPGGFLNSRLKELP